MTRVGSVAYLMASAGHDCLMIALNHDRESTLLSGEVNLFRARRTFAGGTGRPWAVSFAFHG